MTRHYRVKYPCMKRHSHCKLCRGARFPGKEDVTPCTEGAHHWVVEGNLGTCKKCHQQRGFVPAVQESHPWVGADALRENFE